MLCSQAAILLNFSSSASPVCYVPGEIDSFWPSPGFQGDEVSAAWYAAATALTTLHKITTANWSGHVTVPYCVFLEYLLRFWCNVMAHASLWFQDTSYQIWFTNTDAKEFIVGTPKQCIRIWCKICSLFYKEHWSLLSGWLASPRFLLQFHHCLKIWTVTSSPWCAVRVSDSFLQSCVYRHRPVSHQYISSNRSSLGQGRMEIFAKLWQRFETKLEDYAELSLVLVNPISTVVDTTFSTVAIAGVWTSFLNYFVLCSKNILLVNSSSEHVSEWNQLRSGKFESCPTAAIATSWKLPDHYEAANSSSTQ
jgi:hypothetical protein